MVPEQLTARILASRFGACWKCMSLTAVLWVASVGTVFVAASWPDQGRVAELGVLAGVGGVGLFGLLGGVHAWAFWIRRARTSPHR